MSRAWHLKSRPQGLPKLENFALESVELPDLEDGMVRVANRWLSVDPYMRGRMNDVKSYVPPFAIDAPWKAGRSAMWSNPAPTGSSRATPYCTWPGGATKRSCPPRR